MLIHREKCMGFSAGNIGSQRGLHLLAHTSMWPTRTEKFQGMIKGYRGVFRLGEATSTWDSDSLALVLEVCDKTYVADLKLKLGEVQGLSPSKPQMRSVSATQHRVESTHLMHSGDLLCQNHPFFSFIFYVKQ